MVLRKFFYLVIVFALVLSACAPADEPESVLRYGWIGQPDTLNPGQAELAETYVILRLVYDALYEYNADGTFSLELAESASVSDDGLVWTFKIRDGITWHDGEPLTAEDVVFTYRFYSAHQEFPYLPGYVSGFADVKATAGNEVVITLPSPISNIDALLFDVPILPAHIWSELSFEDAAAFENSAMIGSGPFKLVSSDGSVIRLAANNDHYLYKPEVDIVEFIFYSTPDEMITAISEGVIDALYSVPVDRVAALKEVANVQVVTGAPTAPGVSDIIINQVLEKNCPLGSICSGHPALRDLRVRRALAHATDKQAIIDTVMLGLGTPGLTLIPAGLGDFYNDQIEDYAYDPDLANELLDSSGYLDTNGDGVREMPDGSRTLTLRIAWPDDIATGAPEAELLQSMWAQIGIETVLEPKSSDDLSSSCCPAFDYDIILWAWGSDPDPDFLLSVLTSDSIESGLNETGYSNPDYDKLYLEQQSAPDRETRREIVWKMQEIMHQDVVYIIPYYEVQVQAYRTDRFTGWLTDSTTLSLERLSNIVLLRPIE